MELLSIVVPCYNEEEAVPIFYRETLKAVESLKDELEIEFCFVDDGSRDGTLKSIKKLCDMDERVHFVSFSRNFGKEAGLYAGLQAAKGDYVATMDVDLQDPPRMLPEMYKIIKDSVGEEDYDCVATRRVTRKGEPPIRSFFARMFYRLINKMSDTEIVDGARDYRFMSRKMVDAILQDQEYNRFTKGIYSWVGFRTKWLEFENVERSVGETKWSFWKLFLYSIDGILAYSTMPPFHCVCSGDRPLRRFVCRNAGGHHSGFDLWRSRGRMAVPGDDYCIPGRYSVVVSGNYRPVYCKDLFRDKKKTDLYCS